MEIVNYSLLCYETTKSGPQRITAKIPKGASPYFDGIVH